MQIIKHVGAPCWALVFVCTLALCLALPAQAQEFGRAEEREASGVPYKVFTLPGEATVQVLVLGDVIDNGIYEIGESTQLDELLVLAGGTSPEGRTRGGTREVTVRLYRMEGGRRVVAYEESLGDMLATPERYPDLQDEDVFMVEARMRRRIGWRDILQVVTSVSALVLLIDRVRRVF